MAPRLSVAQLIRSAHLLLCISMVAFMSWGLLAPNPLKSVSGTSFAFLCSIDDFLIHLGVFATVTILLASFVRDQRPAIRHLAVSLVLLQGVTTELLQALIPSRTCDPLDMLANIVGVTIGMRVAEVLQNLVSSVLTTLAARNVTERPPNPSFWL